MIETFTLLLLAHVLADFVLQADWMVRRKAELPVLLLHFAIVFATAIAATGAFAAWPVLLALACAHLAIDATKLLFGDHLRPFLMDQAAHLVTLAACAFFVPTLWAGGAWPAYLPAEIADRIPPVAAIFAGAILAVTAGGHAVAKLLDPRRRRWPRHRILAGSLPDAGRMIGQLERAVAFWLVVIGQSSGVAFLVAAKSILRFSATRDDRRIAEYVIIGTLASLGWAFVVGTTIRALYLALGGIA